MTDTRYGRGGGMNEVAENRGNWRPESERDRMLTPQMPGFGNDAANESGRKGAGGDDQGAEGPPFKKWKGNEVDSPHAGGAVDHILASEPWRKPVPEGGRGGGDIGGSVGGSGGCINGGGGGNGCSNIASSAGGDGYNGGGGTIGGSISGGRDGKGSGNISSGVGGGGYNGGGGNTGGRCTDGGSVGDDGIIGGSAGGALDPMIASEPRRQLVPGSSVGGGLNGGSGGIGGTVGGVDINGSGSGSIGGSVGADDGNGGGSNNGVSNSSSGIIGGSVGGALDPTVKSGPLRQSVPGGGSGYGNIGGSISGNGGGFCGGSVGIGGDNGSSGGGSADGALDSRFASKTYRQSVAQGGGGAGGNGGGGLNGSGGGSGGVHGGGSVDIGGSVCGVGVNGNGGGSIGGSVGGVGVNGSGGGSIGGSVGGGGGDGGGHGGGSGTIGGRIGGVGVNGSGGGSTGGSVGGVGVTGSGGGSGNIDGRIGGVGVNGGGGGSIGGSSGGLGVNGSGGGSISGSVGGGGGGNGDWDINDVSFSSRIGGGIIGFRDSSGGDNGSGRGGITGGSVGDGGDSGGGIGRSDDGGADNRSGHLVPSSARMSTNPLDDSQVAPAAAEGVGEPSQAPSSAVCTQPAPPAMKNPVGRRPACGKAVCGDTTGWEDPCSLCDDKPSHAGRLLCSACHDGPMKKPRIKTRWVHIANVKDLEKSVRLWEAHLAATPGMKTIVKPGFRPTMSCLCIRPACYYMTWRKLDFAERRRNPPRCVACMTKNTAAWRPPGKELALIQRWLSEGEPSGTGVKENGTVLEADSRICDDCDAEFRNTGKKWVSEHAPKFSMKTLDLYLRQRPAPHSGQARELVFYLVEREMLEILMKGRPVLLEDAVEMVVKARACAGYAEVQRARLVGQAVEVLECVSDFVTDAFYVCFDGEQVGESKRHNVRYLMPERIHFL